MVGAESGAQLEEGVVVDVVMGEVVEAACEVAEGEGLTG